jgi:hypothetical protein
MLTFFSNQMRERRTLETKGQKHTVTETHSIYRRIFVKGTSSRVGYLYFFSLIDRVNRISIKSDVVHILQPMMRFFSLSSKVYSLSYMFVGGLRFWERQKTFLLSRTTWYSRPHSIRYVKATVLSLVIRIY